MAQFFKPPDVRISRQNLFLPLGETMTLGLWGAQEEPGRYLDIRVSNPAIASFADPLNSFRDWAIQQFKLRGNSLGRLRVEAVSRAGIVWDWIEVTVIEMDTVIKLTPMTQIYQAIQQGKLSFINVSDKRNFLAVYEGEQINGNTVQYSEELLKFLIAVLDGGRLTVLSLYRYNQSMHGEIQKSGEVVCRAVDIAAYGGVPITLDLPPRVISTIVSIIDKMPPALYQCGFPRPGGHEKFDPSKDVFFPVKDQETAMKCWNGTIAMDRSQLLPQAKAAVVPALQRAESRGAAFKAMYPDGLNHFCVFALPK